jgi:hypothetical protein
MRHLQVELNADLLLTLALGHPDLVVLLADSGKNVLHLLLSKVLAQAVARTASHEIVLLAYWYSFLKSRVERSRLEDSLVVWNEMPAVDLGSLPALGAELKSVFAVNVFTALKAAKRVDCYLSALKNGKRVFTGPGWVALLMVVSLGTARGSFPLLPPPTGRVASFSAILTFMPTISK